MADKPLSYHRVGGTCSAEGCNKPARSKDLCNTHSERLRIKGSLFEDVPIKPRLVLPKGTLGRTNNCTRPVRKAGCCEGHYSRLRTVGYERTPTFEGKTLVDADGYVLEYRPEALIKAKYVSQHRFVMEQKLGRQLTNGETVHHKNGLRHDNSPDNLELWTSPQEPGERVSDLIVWAKQLLEQYGENENLY